MIYTASSAADQTACWITGIVIAALIFLFVKFAAKGSKPLEKRNRTADYTHRQGAGTRQLQPGNRIFGERKKKRQADTHTNILGHRADSPVVHTDTEH